MLFPRFSPLWRAGAALLLGLLSQSTSVAATPAADISPEAAPLTNPLIRQRADPFVVRHTDGFYYFIATVPEYDRLELRRAPTLAGLATAEPKTIWRKHATGPMGAHIWAPELHFIDGRWFIYFSAGAAEKIWDIRLYVLENPGANPLEGEWTERGQLKTNWESFTLDATTFEHRGTRYLVWAQRDPAVKNNTDLYLAKMDSPTSITGRQMLLSRPEFAWEKVRYAVNEAPAVLIRNGRVFITYSAAGTGAEYCLGLLTANADADLLDPHSWTKTPTPVFATSETHGIFGPGHNSFTTSPDGRTDLLVYHARNYRDVAGNPLRDPNRHTRVQPIVWRADGTPEFGQPAAETVPPFRAWAPTPPMGWNSWDNFATTLTEAQTKAQADFMAAQLKAHGWQYIVVDIQWYEPGAESHAYRSNAVLTMDDHGRLTPALNRFPSAANGAGFKPLADYIHGLGLKMGVHLMRGIPRQAVEKNLPVLGTDIRAADIANRADICPWNPDMFGVDMTRPGAQAYYDSVFAQFAAWGIDYVKVDDISRPYHAHAAEIEAIRRAIDRTGRPMVLSLSPGETALTAAPHARDHANLWRISDDFWDRWLALRDQFARLEAWNPHRVAGAWPDADMLPLGVLNLGTRTTRFTPDEQRTMMTLWSIARSPLMHGGDMTKTDDATLALLTNDEVLAVNQRSANNRPLFNRDELIAWVADVPDSPDKYLAVFNARDRVRLRADNARYASAPTRAATPAAVDADLSGGTRLILAVEPAETAGEWNRILWRDPRLVFADGTERPLTELKWTHADACWDSTAVKKDAAGKVLGLAAEIPAIVEYDLPAGAVRFRATGVVDSNGRGHEPGPVRFLVVVDAPGATAPTTTLPVAVDLAELGFPNGARVRDLWTHRDLGKFTGEFAPEIAFHGAGLYRLSPPR